MHFGDVLQLAHAHTGAVLVVDVSDKVCCVEWCECMHSKGHTLFGTEAVACAAVAACMRPALQPLPPSTQHSTTRLCNSSKQSWRDQNEC